jgi:hypothetical protein
MGGFLSNTLSIMIDLDHQLHRFGYWLVDGMPVYNKSQAAYQATIKNTHDVRFYFNDHVYDNFDWQVPIPQTLKELYANRARQLRDQYQHLVVLYSGGSDSSNALAAMLEADILPDEIVYHWAGGADSQKNTANAEIINAAWPMLEHLSHEYNVKITCFDEYDLYQKFGFNNSEWILQADAVLNPCTYPRYQMLQNHSPWLDLVQQGQRVGLVMGIDKPRVLWENNQWWGTFLDVGFQHNFYQDHIQDSGITIEGFYSTPKSPLITIKQSQVLKNYLDLTYDLDFRHQNFTRSSWNGELYNTLVRRICYPYWNDATFSIGKSHVIYDRKHLWWLENNNELSQNYFSGLDWINQNIDPWFLNQGTVYHGYRGVFSRTYKL